MNRPFLITLSNIINNKKIKRKAQGETRTSAIAFLCGKLKHPENYIVEDITSVTT